MIGYVPSGSSEPHFLPMLIVASVLAIPYWGYRLYFNPSWLTSRHEFIFTTAFGVILLVTGILTSLIYGV